jgi:Spy/CpxP family protein refolding chaperone
MHPGMFYWWKKAQEHAQQHADEHGGTCGQGRGQAHCGPGGGANEGGGWGRRGWGGHHHGGDDGGGGLGVRRPLRFLAHKLGLKDPQVAELARILNDLKTERAQAEVDDRRTLAAFADAVSGDTFNQARVDEGATLRLKSAERLREAVSKALSQIHALLDTEQRSQLAYMIRTGTLTL